MSERKTVDGVAVVGRTANQITLKLPSGSPSFDSAAAVELTQSGRTVRGHIVDMIESDAGLLSTVNVPNVTFAMGDTVAVTQSPRFSLHAHDRAVQRFLDYDVEGPWDYLCLLLCRPQGLPGFNPEPVSRFFLEQADPSFKFDPEQKAAIAGAIAAPHAFFIKGPPGTGKTSVIAETVLQLIARGERVLLLAPMHVALDEVLSRVTSEPDVLPVRVSWAESLVNHALRRFLPEKVAWTYLQGARTRATSKAPKWRDELNAIRPKHEAIKKYLSASQELDTCNQILQSSGASLESSNARYQATLAGMEADLAEVVARLKTVKEEISDTTEELAKVRTERTEFDQNDGRAESPKVAWAQERGELSREISRLERKLVRLRREREDLTTRGTRLDSVMFESAVQQAEERASFAAEVEYARNALPSATQALNEATTALETLLGSGPCSYEIENWRQQDSVLDVKVVTLENLIALEERWFELSGMTELAEPTELPVQLEIELRQAANLVCVTTTGAATRSLEGVDFDTVIVDEASRVVDSEFLIGATRGNRWILVGDDRQLPPYVNPEDENHLHALSALRMVDSRRARTVEDGVETLSELWLERSEPKAFRREAVVLHASVLQQAEDWPAHRQAFARAARVAGPAAKGPERHVLRLMRRHMFQSLFERAVASVRPELVKQLEVQHRMIEPIASLVNEPIYGGAYRTLPDEGKVEPFVLPAFGAPVTFLDTTASGDKARDTAEGSGFVNELEAKWVHEVCTRLETELRRQGSGELSVSILTFYKRQAQLIRRVLGDDRARAFGALKFHRIDVIDRIQGQQSDVVILSFCRATTRRRIPAGYGTWLQDVRRLNVAFTRARRGLILIGHRSTLAALRGFPDAQEFYQHVFRTLEGRSDVMKIITDL